MSGSELSNRNISDSDLLKYKDNNNTIKINELHQNLFLNNSLKIDNISLNEYELEISNIHFNGKIEIIISNSNFKKITIGNINSEVFINIWSQDENSECDLNFNNLENDENKIRLYSLNIINTCDLIRQCNFRKLDLKYIKLKFEGDESHNFSKVIRDSTINELQIFKCKFNSYAHFHQNRFKNIRIEKSNFKYNVDFEIANMLNKNKNPIDISGISIIDCCFENTLSLSDKCQYCDNKFTINLIQISKTEINNKSDFIFENTKIDKMLFVFDSKKKNDLKIIINQVVSLELQGELNSDTNEKLDINIENLTNFDISNFKNYGKIECSIGQLKKLLSISNSNLGDFSISNLSIVNLQTFTIRNSSINNLKLYTIIWGDSILKLNKINSATEKNENILKNALRDYNGAKNLKMVVETNNDLTAKDFTIQREFELFKEYIKAKNSNLTCFERLFEKNNLILSFGKINDYGRGFYKPALLFVCGNVILTALITFLYYFLPSMDLSNFTQKVPFFKTAIKIFELQVSPLPGFGNLSSSKYNYLFFFLLPIVILIKAVNIILVYQIVEAFRKYIRK